MSSPPLIIRHHAQPLPYLATQTKMRDWASTRQADQADEIWLCEHPPVITLGQAALRQHLIAPAPMPVVQSDRGGQVTYHGPGQCVLYTLFHLPRLNIGIKTLVHRLEQVVIDTLATWNILATRRPGAPGVYIGTHKIAAIGLRIRRGCSYHGLALNIHNDLKPFHYINPCGYAKLPVTRLVDHAISLSDAGILAALVAQLLAQFGHHVVADNRPSQEPDVYRNDTQHTTDRPICKAQRG